MTPAQTVQALASPHMASVSRCRAAVRRWGAGATFALQIPVVSNTRHQTKGKPAPLRTCVERFVPTAPTAVNRVGAREAPVYAVSPLPPLPPLQMSVPRGATPGRCVGFGLVARLAWGRRVMLTGLDPQFIKVLRRVTQGGFVRPR